MTFEYCLQIQGQRPAGRKSRGALLNAFAWPHGSVISVRFLDRSEVLEPKIKDVAQEWLDRSGASLVFKWVEGADAQIRIGLRPGGSWSYVGTRCLDIKDQKQPTMSYGWLHDGSSELEIREVVLHEFGHALGLVHEHQHPKVSIPWDKDAVRAELSGPPNLWDRATIDHNMFEAYDARDMTATDYDPDSIMHYPVPERWTTDGFTVGSNTDLSTQDIELIRGVYR